MLSSIQWFKEHGYDMIPGDGWRLDITGTGDGFMPAGVRAVLDALVNMLDRFGTMSFTEIT